MITENDIKTYVSVSCDNGSMNSLSYSMNYTLNASENLYVSDFKVKGLPVSKYEPTKGDKIYFLKGCTVPRFKVKQFCETYGVALVKDPAKANVKFIGPESISEVLVSAGSYFVNKHHFISFWKPRLINTDVIETIFKAIEESDLSVMQVEYQMLSDMKKLDKRFQTTPDSPNVKFIDLASAKQYVHISSGMGVYDQIEILRRINTGGIMTREHYHSIKRLFDSSDLENVKLAMEAMANCDYEQSCVFLLLLIREYGRKMFESPNKNHVNFKSMLKFFDIVPRQIDGIDINNIIEALIKRKLLNKSNMDLLMPEIVKDIDGSTGYNDYFKVKDIIPTEGITEAIRENMLDKNCNTEVLVEDEELTFKAVPTI